MITPSRTIAVLVALAFIVAGSVDPAHARGKRKRARRARRGHHVSWVYQPPPYGYCRIGWWQTLKYGKVRPRWAAFCRRYW